MTLSNQQQINAEIALGALLRRYRKKKKISQQEVAKRIGCGLHRQLVGKIERGEVEVRALHLAFMLDLLGVPKRVALDTLMGKPVPERYSD